MGIVLRTLRRKHSTLVPIRPVTYFSPHERWLAQAVMLGRVARGNRNYCRSLLKGLYQ